MPVPHLVIEQDGATPVEGKDRQTLLRRLRALKLVDHPNAKATVVKRWNLPFYEDVVLIELTNPGWAGAQTRLCFLDDGSTLTWLDGTSPPIHAINAEADLRINEGNVLEYLAFFCFYVRGQEGPFLILDRTANGFIPSSVELRRVEEIFRPSRILGQDHNGDWRVSAMVYYADGIFCADFVVHLSGMISMAEDWPVATDLGARIDAPLVVAALS